MLIRRRKIKKLSDDIRRIIDGQYIDLRDNNESVFSALKNDIHTLAYHKKEQFDALQRDQHVMMDMLANISHQLKTPLTSMTIMADLLDDAPLEKRTEFSHHIKAGLARMDWLVSSLLKMAKLDAGAIVFAAEQIPACELINMALEPLQVLLEVKNQQVSISADTKITCDIRWTAEALTNVLKNASEYSPEGGEIHVVSGENPICAWVSVTDSGLGMNSTQMAGLFKRFEGSRSEQGYGIGLPLALAIMREQNGDVEVANENTGAMFTLKVYR